MRKYLLIHVIIFSFIFLSIPIIQSRADGKPPRTELRSSYTNLSVSQVQSMPNVSIRRKKALGFYGHSTIQHEYEKIGRAHV